MLYEEFNTYISEFTEENDFWYDVGAIRATEILSRFIQQDWDKLLLEINKKSLHWKKKLAYCLESNHNANGLSALLFLVTTDDDELIEICVDSLRGFSESDIKASILVSKELLNHINESMKSAGVVTKKIYADFLKKIRE
jgi:hypothetical protein